MTTAAAGRGVRVTLSTSSSSVGGATSASRRWYRRSIASAKATTEHRIKGQIGQPAACMIDSKAFSCGCSGHSGPKDGRDYGRTARALHVIAQCAWRWFVSRAHVVHRSCGQLCGQHPAQSRQTLHSQGLRFGAEFLSTIFSLRINSLRLYDDCMTAAMARRALIDAPVEFPTRASRAFCHG